MGIFFRVVTFYSFYVKSAPPITKLGAFYLCEGYVNIARVLNVWLDEQSKILKYWRNKITAFNFTAISFTNFLWSSGEFYYFTISVIEDILNASHAVIIIK